MPEPVTPEGSVPPPPDHETKQITPQDSEAAQRDPGTAQIERSSPAQELAEELTSGDQSPGEKLRQVAGESGDEQAQQEEQSQGAEEPELSPAEKLNAIIKEEIDRKVDEDKGAFDSFKRQKTRDEEHARAVSVVSTRYLLMARDLTGLPVDDVDGIGPAFEDFLRNHSIDELRARVAKVPPDDQYAHEDTRANLRAFRDGQLALIDSAVGAGIGQAESGQQGITASTEAEPADASPAPEDSGRVEKERTIPEGYYTVISAQMDALLETRTRDPKAAREAYEKYLKGEADVNDFTHLMIDPQEYYMLSDKMPYSLNPQKLDQDAFMARQAEAFNRDRENIEDDELYKDLKFALEETQEAKLRGRGLMPAEIEDHTKLLDRIAATLPAVSDQGHGIKRLQEDWIQFNRVSLGLRPEPLSGYDKDAFIAAFPENAPPLTWSEFNRRAYDTILGNTSHTEPAEAQAPEPPAEQVEETGPETPPPAEAAQQEVPETSPAQEEEASELSSEDAKTEPVTLKEAASRLNSMIARVVYRNNPDMLYENEKNETTVNTGRRKKFIEALHAEIPELKTIGKGLVSKHTEERPEEQLNTDKQGGFLSGLLKRFGISREEPQKNPDLKPLPEYSGKQYHTNENGEEGEDMNPVVRGHSEEEHDEFEDFVRNDLEGQISPLEEFISAKAYDAYDEEKFEYSYNRNNGIENDDPEDNTVNKDFLYKYRLTAARFKVEKDYIKEKILSYVPQSKAGQRAVLAGASLYIAGLTYLKMRNAGVFDQLEQSARDFMDNLPARTVPGVGIPAPEIAAQETASTEAPQTETVPTPAEAAPAAPESTLPGTTNEDIGGPPVEGGNNLSVDENYYNVPLELTQDFGFMVDIPKNANPAEIQQQIATASEFYAEQTGIPVQEARAQVVKELQSTFNDAGIAIDVTPETNEAAQPPTEATESPEEELPLEVSYDQEYNVYEIPVEKGEFGAAIYLSPDEPAGASREYLDTLTEMYIQDTGSIDSNDQAAFDALRQELAQNIQQEITTSDTLTQPQKEQLQQLLTEAVNYVPEVTFDAENNSFAIPYDQPGYHTILNISPESSTAEARSYIDSVVQNYLVDTGNADIDAPSAVDIVRQDVVQDMQQLVSQSDALNQQQKDQLQQMLSEAAAYTAPAEATPSASPTTEAPAATTSAPSETPGTTAPAETAPTASEAPAATQTSEPAPTTTPAPTETLESAAPGAPTTEPGTTQTEQPTESTPPVEQPEAPAPGEPTPEQAPQLTNEQVQQQLDAIFRNNDVAYIVQDGDSRSQIISDFVEANKESIPGGNWVNEATGVTKGAVLADMLNDFAQQNNVELPTLHPDDEITPASLLELNLTEDQMRVIAEAMTTENVDQYLNDVQPRYELVKDGQPLPPLEPEPAPEPIIVPAEFPAELQDEFTTFDHVVVDNDRQSDIIRNFVDQNAAQLPGENWTDEANGQSKATLFADMYRTFQVRHGMNPDLIIPGEHITFADWNKFTPEEQQVLIETLNTNNMQEYLDNVVPDYEALNATTETQEATPEQTAEQPAEPQIEMQDVPQLNEMLNANFTIQHPGGPISSTIQQYLAQIDTFRNWPQQDGLNNLSAILTDMLVDNSAAHGFNVEDVPAGTYSLADLNINPAELQDLMLRTVEQNSASEYISNVQQDYKNAKDSWR